MLRRVRACGFVDLCAQQKRTTLPLLRQTLTNAPKQMDADWNLHTIYSSQNIFLFMTQALASIKWHLDAKPRTECTSASAFLRASNRSPDYRDWILHYSHTHKKSLYTQRTLISRTHQKKGGIMLPMPMLKIPSTVGASSSAGCDDGPSSAVASQSVQAQAQPESSSYFQHLLASVHAIDLEAGTSSSSVTNTKKQRIKKQYPQPPAPTFSFDIP